MDNAKLWKIAKIVLHGTMGLLYLMVGYYVIVKRWFITPLDQTLSLALGIVLIAYGIFRIYRTRKIYQE